MILPLHIAISIFSLIFTGYTFFVPSSAKIKTSYALVFLVFATGFYLIWSKPVHMVQTCSEGLAYLGVLFAGILAAQKKLTKLEKLDAKHSLV